MKRNSLGVILLAVFLGLGITPAVMATPVVNLALLDPPVGINDSFQVEVWADGDDIGRDLLSFGFDVTTGTGGIFDYAGYTLGPGFTQTIGFGPDVKGSAAPGIAADDVLLATLAFTTLAIGTDTLRITGLYDGGSPGMFSIPGLDYGSVELVSYRYDIDRSLAITVNAHSVPEPATGAILLICFGWVGLAEVKRRCKQSL